MHKFDILQNYFHSGKTLSYNHRKDCLERFEKLLNNHQNEMIEALQADFNKPPFETLVTEISMLQKELHYFKKNLRKWVKPKGVRASILNFPSKEYIAYQPYGVVLIIAPWNYPLLLSLQPLIAALAAGNCAVLKPSELSPATSQLLHKLISKYFNPELIQVVEGGVEETSLLLKQPFHKIFFTGSTSVGKIVQKAAAENLTPIVLELGGKSPCIITPSTQLKLAAKRIVFGKFVNAGQTCIAPDFIFIHPKVEQDFIKEVENVLNEFYGDEPENSPYFARIINEKHFHRIKQYVLNGEVLIGGQTNSKKRYIAPTLIKIQSLDDEVMQNEIFGPVLPIINYTNIQEIVSYNQQHPKPLAFYIFGKNNSEIDYLLSHCQFGGACINDVLSHIINNKLPFGGFGASGFGKYHGKFGFDAFTHKKAIVYRKNWYDNSLKYPPYTQEKFNLLKKIFKLFQ